MENKEVKEKKSKKGLIIGLVIGGSILLIAAIVLLILFLLKPTYKITVNTNGKKLVKDIVISDNEIKELPEVELTKSEYLVAWVNDKGEAIRPGLPVSDIGEIEPIIGDPMEGKVTISFETGTDEKLSPITINKGSGIILHVKPKDYMNWKFMYWIDKNGYIVKIGIPLYEDLTVYAYWDKSEPSKPIEKVKISFDTGTNEKLEDVELPIGSKYLFRTPVKSNGNKIFRGWLDEDGNLLDENSIVKKAMTLKAKWVEPYTCPEDCTPSEDGKTCTRKVERDMEHSAECVDPYEIINGKCLDTANKFSAFGYDSPSGGSGECPAGYYEWDDCYSLGCDKSCAKEVPFETGSWCPEGYTEENGKCVRTETVECTAN